MSWGAGTSKMFPPAQEIQIQLTAQIRSVNFQLSFTVRASGKKYTRENTHNRQQLIKNVNNAVRFRGTRGGEALTANPSGVSGGKVADREIAHTTPELHSRSNTNSELHRAPFTTKTGLNFAPILLLIQCHPLRHNTVCSLYWHNKSYLHQQDWALFFFPNTYVSM